MSVQMHTIRACQLRTLPHQLGRDGEGRTRSKHDAQHGVPARVMILLDGPLRVAQDRVLILDHTIRWQAALRFADRHGATGGVKAEAHLHSRRDLIVDTGAIGPDVTMITRRRAAGKYEFSDGRSGTDGDGSGGETRPDRVMDA